MSELAKSFGRGCARLRLMLFGNRNLFAWDVRAEKVHSWLHDLLALVHIAESLPAPTRTAEPSHAERVAQRIRQSKPWVLPAIIAVAMKLLLACLLGAGILRF